jgi:hypothetical protein
MLHGAAQDLGVSVADKSVLLAVTSSSTTGFSFEIVSKTGAVYTPSLTPLKVDYIVILIQ